MSVIPAAAEDYTRQFCMRCRTSVDPDDKISHCAVCKRSDELHWMFTIAFVLRDATAQIRAVLTGDDAIKFFGGLSPCDLRLNNATRELIKARVDSLLDREKFLDACLIMYQNSEPGRRFRIFQTRLL